MNQKLINIACISLAGLLSGIAWADPTVTDITLVNEKRISRTVFEYTYKATITNDGTARHNVKATLNSAGSGTSIIEGIVDIGELSANQVITSTDTFILQQDRKFTFDRTALVWSFESEAIPDAPGNLNELTIFPKLIPAARDTKVMVMIKIDDPSVFSGNPRLERLDSKGNAHSILATFVDDGTQGDAIAGDRWYTIQGVINEASPGQIYIRATATAKATSSEILSPVENVEVELGADASGPFAVQQSDKLVFRNIDGSIASEVDLSPTQESFSDSTGNYFIVNNFYSISTRNQKRVGILTITFLEPDQPPQETETSSLHGSNFIFRDANAILWSKSLPVDTDTQFYVPDSNAGPSAMFSSDGNRVLLIIVNEENGSPTAQIYDASGVLVTEFASKLRALYSPRISGNGRYVLLEGSFPISEGGGYGFEVLDIETHLSYIQLLDLAAIDSYAVVEGDEGKFKVLADGATLYQLP